MNRSIQKLGHYFVCLMICKITATTPIRRRPYAAILLDEIEKAHPDVFNVLLQLLDDGRLTDGQGRVVSFKNCVVIMTSNLASHLIAEAEPNDFTLKDRVFESLRAHFRPEFTNRIDEVIVFNSLQREQLSRIVEIQLEGLRKRLAERHQYHVERSGASGHRRRGLRPTVRRAPTQARDPTIGSRPARPPRAKRRSPRRRHGRNRRRPRRSIGLPHGG